MTKVLSQQFCHNKHVFATTKHVFCHDKFCCDKLTYKTRLLLQQKYASRDKIFLLRQACKQAYLQNTSFVVTKVLSQQTCVCHDKYLSQQKYFVMASILLLQLKMCFVATNMSDKSFVTKKVILVAAPTNDIKL